MKDDYISRQAAIDTVMEFMPKLSTPDGSGPFDREIFEAQEMFVDIGQALNELPPAQPERKKGKWVKVHGYATPGGDPVWACSECGKGIHVYGIEHSSYGKDVADGQWVACPNCGAEMLGEIWTK